MCGGRSIRSDIAFVEIVICRRQNALKERLFACGKSELLFYFHFTEAQCQILLSYVTIARLCNKKMKNIIRFLWREIVNEPTGIYELGIILAEV